METEVVEDAKDDAAIKEAAEVEQRDLESFIADTKSRISQRTEMRRVNVLRVLPPEEYFFKLDSSLKKNTAFVKKLKLFTAAQMDVLLKDMAGLNLSKYISEISQALVEAKLKMTDVMPAVTLCNKFHQIYGEFSQTFLESWHKILTLKSNEKVANPSKMRVDLRFFAELVIVGIFNNKSGLSLLGSAVTTLINQDKEEFSNLTIILSFCKNCGDEFAGLVSKKMLELSDKFEMPIPNSEFLTPEKQQNLKNLLKDYYTALVKHVKRQHKELMDAERSNLNMMSSKGEVPEDKRERLEHLQSSFEKLLSSTQVLSDLLNEQMPDFPKAVEMNEGGVILDSADGITDQELDPWGDEETKSFYVNLPDLRLFLPNFAPKLVETTPEEPPMTEEALDMDIDTDQLTVDEPVQEIISEIVPETASTPEPVVEEPNPSSEAKTTVNTNSKQYYDNFVNNLGKCVNRELIDSAAIEFLLQMNTKNNRKKISRSIFGVHRTRLDLLPFYGRFTATLNLVSPDVANELARLLKNDFKYHVREKDQINIESKIKVVRFIGELVKFGLYSKIEALFCLKVLLHDFNHHNIEMVCAFLEVCGVYLYNCKESRLRTNVYLEQMMRLKTVNAFDPRHTALIENSYYLIKPPEGGKMEKRIRTPIQRYIRHLIFEELNKSNVDKIIKLMRSLNWDDKEMNDYAVRCLSKAYNLRYHIIRCLADLVSGLSSYQDKAMMKVIDCVFEDIRAGLEIHSPKLAQRRVAMAKYLGELYNYRLIESTNVLNTLYSIISLGVTLDHNSVSIMDPPGSLFRLKLACVLLDTCGEYFTSSLSRKRLDYFLIFFQQYYWFKKSDPIFSDEDDKDLFPILTDHTYKDCLKNLRPRLKLFMSFEEAQEAVEGLRQQLYPTLGQDGGLEDSNTNLSTINEMDSDNELTPDDNTSEAEGNSDDEGRQMRKKEGDDYEEMELEKDEEDDLDEEDMDNEDNSDLERDLYELEQKELEEDRQTQEDLEFEQMYDKMALDCYQERIRESIKPTTKDIPVPMMAKSTKKTYENLQQAPAPEEPQSVPFVLMMRGSKSGKQQFKTFNAPADSHMAVNLKLQEQKIKEENESVKR